MRFFRNEIFSVLNVWRQTWDFLNQKQIVMHISQQHTSFYYNVTYIVKKQDICKIFHLAIEKL